MIPKREVATNNGQTYFVTSPTSGRRSLFRNERWAKLFVEILYGYRSGRYLLHGFVLMPNHFHVLMTPVGSLERAVQCLKGGFSYRAKREFGWNGDVWAAGFSDHRIRDDEDFRIHLAYIARNPVKARLVENAAEYPYSSANGRFELDPFPQGLKPAAGVVANGAAKAAPFQSKDNFVPQELKPTGFWEEPNGTTEVVPFQSSDGFGDVETAEAVPFQSKDNFVPQGLKPNGFWGELNGTTEVVPFQSNDGFEPVGAGQAVPFQCANDFEVRK